MVAISVAAIALDLRWMTAVINYGFVARVITGPTLTTLGQLVTGVVTASRRPRRCRSSEPGAAG